MDNDDIGCIAGVVAFCGVAFIAAVFGSAYGNGEFKKEAVAKGHAEWVLIVNDNGTTRTDWQWKNHSADASKKVEGGGE